MKIYFDEPIEILKIPYANTTLPGYFIKPDASGPPRKTLLCTGGYDGTCEELFFIIAGGALERGESTADSWVICQRV